MFLASLGVALVFAWEASTLDSWSIMGPGPGLFAVAATLFTAGIAAVLTVFPRLAADGNKAEAEAEPEPTEKRHFWSYAGALVFLAVAPSFLGFILTSLVLVMALSWKAEGRGWRPALVFALFCGLVGVIGFGHVLGASIPLGAADQFVLRLLRLGRAWTISSWASPR